MEGTEGGEERKKNVDISLWNSRHDIKNIFEKKNGTTAADDRSPKYNSTSGHWKRIRSRGFCGSFLSRVGLDGIFQKKKQKKSKKKRYL